MSLDSCRHFLTLFLTGIGSSKAPHAHSSGAILTKLYTHLLFVQTESIIKNKKIDFIGVNFFVNELFDQK